MTTLKNGSRGTEVKTLQAALNKFAPYGLKEDGVFGAKTETAVKDFQFHKELKIDGVVGPKTWEALGIKDSSSKCIDPSVIFKPLSVHVTKGRQTPQYLSIHFTAGSNSNPGKAQAVYNTFVSREASADFAVDDRDMVQFNPDIDNYYCWAVGDKKNPYSSGGTLNGKATNRNTISIEICSTCVPATSTAVNTPNHPGWSFTDAALNNAAKLAKIIMKKYNIPLSRVVRHYDITGKLCPGIIGWNNETIYDINGKATKEKSDSSKWEQFKRKLM